MIGFFTNLYQGIFGAVERATQGWFLGLFARFVFLAVLFFYYIHSAGLKVGPGFAGFFELQFSAYIQILSEQGLAAYDFDPANVPFFPQYLMVLFGTYMEFLLPILIVLGLFTRAASLGMIVFVIVQSYVDIAFHKAGAPADDIAKTLGAWFDNPSGSLIMDQRLLWVFVLTVLVIKGAGKLSIDEVLSRWWAARSNG